MRQWTTGALALLIGTAFGFSPHSTTHRIPSLAGGVLAALLAYALLRHQARRRAALDQPAPLPTFARPPTLFWVGLALFAALFSPTAIWLFGLASKGIWTSPQGMILPFVIVFLARAELRRCDAPPPGSREGEAREPGREDSSPWGLVLVALGLSLIVFDSAAQTENLSALGFALCLPGLSLLLLGMRRTLALKAPLLLVMFTIPIPNVVADLIAMREISAIGTAAMLNLVGIPTHQQHALVILPGQPYGFSYECSGLQLVYAGFALASTLAIYSGSWLRRALLMLSVYPLALFFNALRTMALLVVAHIRGPSTLETILHGGLGNIAFWMLIASLLALADWPRLRERLA
ncbi:MAG: exosortase/archaeosortase family protein [Deltaproteobacteria bacterium]|nr:exosortase/archaeosortase family protein [Deltaproteobacteria bacterium]